MPWGNWSPISRTDYTCTPTYICHISSYVKYIIIFRSQTYLPLRRTSQLLSTIYNTISPCELLPISLPVPSYFQNSPVIPFPRGVTYMMFQCSTQVFALPTLCMSVEIAFKRKKWGFSNIGYCESNACSLPHNSPVFSAIHIRPPSACDIA